MTIHCLLCWTFVQAPEKSRATLQLTLQKQQSQHDNTKHNGNITEYMHVTEYTYEQNMTKYD